MPRSTGQPNSWNIGYSGDRLAKGSPTRRMVDAYKGLLGIDQDEALEALVKAGFDVLVGSKTLDQILLDRPPTQRRVGKRSAIEESTRSQGLQGRRSVARKAEKIEHENTEA